MNPITFPGLGLTFHIQRVAFQIFGKDIYWYGIIIAAGFLLAAAFCSWRARDFGIKKDDFLDMLLWGLPIGIICARIYYVIFYLSLYRDARLVDGFPARPIPFEARKPGDLLYFPGHIALYLGNDRYIHSTARAGSDGVVINSLDPAAPDYRADLREKLYAVGSVFPLA